VAVGKLGGPDNVKVSRIVALHGEAFSLGHEECNFILRPVYCLSKYSPWR